MKKELKRSTGTYYYKGEERFYGVPDGITGDLSGITGDLSDITGDIDACELTDEDKKRGVNVSELIQE